MTVIAAKPTLYKGTRFRSRLEARWAVFFDAIEREWVYEPTFPELRALSYQPDFLLDGGSQAEATSVVEVKPWPGQTGDWTALAEYLNRTQGEGRYGKVASVLQTRMMLLIGSPGLWEQGKLTDYGSVAVAWDHDRVPNALLEWAECPICGYVAMCPDGKLVCCSSPIPNGSLFQAFGKVRDESYVDAR